MPKWLSLPADKLYYQPDQLAFLAARRLRNCPKCQKQFIVQAPTRNCPTCDTRGNRVYDRLTVIAGRRFGKSLFGSIAAVEEALIDNSVVWCCAPTNPKLHRYVIPALQKLIPPEWVLDWSSEYGDLRLTNNSLIHFQTLEDPDQGRGQGLDALWIDEVCELTEDHWNVIEPSLGDRQGVGFFTTSPRSFDWVYNRLYKPAEDGFIITAAGEKKKVEGFWALHAQTADNPIFQTVEGKAFLEQQEATMPGTMFQQEYLADFVTFTGAVYGSALDSQILRTTEQINQLIPEWPAIAPWRQVLVGLDTGADHPFAAVKLVSTERGLVAVDEYLERDRPYIQHARYLKAFAGNPNTRWGCNKNERIGILELAQHGIYCQKAENDVIAGTEHVKSMLHNNKLWIVESRCPRLIKQMRAYRYDDTKKSDGQAGLQKVYKKDDDLPDALRYICMIVWSEIAATPPVESGYRDISDLSPDMQRTIERNRRHEKKEEDNADKSLDQDFWSREVELWP